MVIEGKVIYNLLMLNLENSPAKQRLHYSYDLGCITAVNHVFH